MIAVVSSPIFRATPTRETSTDDAKNRVLRRRAPSELSAPRCLETIREPSERPLLEGGCSETSSPRCLATGAMAMARRKPRPKPLGTIWEIPDELWRRIEPILKEFWPKKPTGRRVANWRKMLNGDHLPDAERLPVGPTARAVRPQEHGPRLVPAVGPRRDLREDLGGAGRRVRRTRRRAVAVAIGRRDAGQGPVRGGKRRARIPPIAARRGPRRAC